MKAKAYVVHSVPGRTRLRIHNRQHDREFFDSLEQRVAKLPQVKSVKTDARTGSVLLHHSGPAFDLLLAAARAGLGELIEIETPAPVGRQLQAEGAQLDDLVRRVTAGQLDLSTLAMFGLVTLAGVQLVQGSQPMIAVTLAWYGAGLLRRWESPIGNPSAPAVQITWNRVRS
jgi:hypothetical protein